jgi:cation transport ATPase
MPTRRARLGLGPEIVCKFCHELRLPGQKCETCMALKEKRLKQKELEAPAKALLAQHTANVKKRWKAAQKKRITYLKYNAELHKTKYKRQQIERHRAQLKLFMSCFERDEEGKWHLYEDRLDDFQAIMDVLNGQLPVAKSS